MRDDQRETPSLTRSEDVRSTWRILLFVREDLSSAIGKDQRQFFVKLFRAPPGVRRQYLLKKHGS